MCERSVSQRLNGAEVVLSTLNGAMGHSFANFCRAISN